MKMAIILVSLVSSMAMAGETVFVSARTLMYPGGDLHRYTQVQSDIYWQVKEKKLCENGIAKLSNITIQVDADFSATEDAKKGFRTQATTYPTVTYNASVECK
jgi:hypothetical protein